MEKGVAAQWSFLEEAADACAVVTRSMEVLFANSVARTLLPQNWYGKHCWDVFPVEDRRCASACPAVRAVQEADTLLYCEETVVPPDSSPLRLGVVVIPIKELAPDTARAVLLLRAKGEGDEAAAFRERLESDARALFERVEQAFS